MNNSKPFSNGTEHMHFNENFCCRCTKYCIDRNGMPAPDNCAVEEAISRAQFDNKHWPETDIVSVNGYFHICRHFTSGNSELMEAYRALFEETEATNEH